MTRGIHALKFGLTLERTQTNTGGPGGFAGGWSTFRQLPEFLDGSPSSLIAYGPGRSFDPRPPVGLGAYVQDDIRLKPRLTINADFATSSLRTWTATIQARSRIWSVRPANFLL